MACAHVWASFPVSLLSRRTNKLKWDFLRSFLNADKKKKREREPWRRRSQKCLKQQLSKVGLCLLSFFLFSLWWCVNYVWLLLMECKIVRKSHKIHQILNGISRPRQGQVFPLLIYFFLLLHDNLVFFGLCAQYLFFCLKKKK